MGHEQDEVGVGQVPGWQDDWGQLLRVARQVAGLSLSELAMQSGLSKGYLSKLESGHPSGRNPSRATLAALARALPGFGPLAHVLEPVTPAVASTLAEVVSLPPNPVAPPMAGDERSDGADDAPLVRPVRLGWRELEVLVAALALERSAALVPLTPRVIARAVDRPLADVCATLDGLARAAVLVCMPPVRVGAAATYRPADDIATRVGLGRLGDALLLAAALLGVAPPRRQPPAGH